jgi:hypothetical protein
MFNNRDGKLLNDSKVKKDELLETIKANLDKHVADVKEALELRQSAMSDYFVAEVEKLTNESYQPKESICFPLPTDSSKDYKKAIKMIEMTQDVIIELNEEQFDRLVMDEWEWKHSLVSTSAVYGKLM